MATNGQTYIHTHMCNAVTLVWGLLRPTPIIYASMPPYIAAQHPHILTYKAQVWDACSSCINLSIGLKLRAIVTPIGSMRPNVFCALADSQFAILRLEYLFLPTHCMCNSYQTNEGLLLEL